jgi:hypothetical protein
MAERWHLAMLVCLSLCCGGVAVDDGAIFVDHPPLVIQLVFSEGGYTLPFAAATNRIERRRRVERSSSTLHASSTTRTIAHDGSSSAVATPDGSDDKPKRREGGGPVERVVDQPEHHGGVRFTHPPSHSFSFVYTEGGTGGNTSTTFQLELELNTALFSTNYSESTTNAAGVVVPVPEELQANSPHLHCHYVGKVRGDLTSAVVASTCASPGGGMSARVTGAGYDLLITPTPLVAAVDPLDARVVSIAALHHTLVPFAAGAAAAGMAPGTRFCGNDDDADLDWVGWGRDRGRKKGNGLSAPPSTDHSTRDNSSKHFGKSKAAAAAPSTKTEAMEEEPPLPHHPRGGEREEDDALHHQREGRADPKARTSRALNKKKYIEVLAVNDAARSGKFPSLAAMHGAQSCVFSLEDCYRDSQLFLA